MIRRMLLLAACLALATGPAHARPAEREFQPPRIERQDGLARHHGRAPAWSQLDARQQHALARFAPRWDRMPPARRVFLLERVQRWQHWSPEQRRAAREGLRNFRALSPWQREQMRQSLRALHRLDDGERERLRAQWRQLSPEQRRDGLRAGGPGVAPPPRDD